MSTKEAQQLVRLLDKYAKVIDGSLTAEFVLINEADAQPLASEIIKVVRQWVYRDLP